MTRQEAARMIGKKYGPASGKRAVESGQLARAGQLAPLAENGRIQGKRNAECGHIQRIQEIGASLGGKAAAAAHPNHIFEITTYETRAKGGAAASHLRWHVKRSKPNPARCELCALELSKNISAVNPLGAENES